MLADFALFALAAAVVWFAGTKVTHYAEAITQRTQIGQAFIGLLLLGGITSLPELATTVTASAHGNGALAVNNLLGGVAAQVVIIALADAFIGDDAVSAVVPRPNILLIGALDILLLTLVAGIIVVGDISVFIAGGGTLLLGAAFFLAIWRMNEARRHESWTPVSTPQHERQPAVQQKAYLEWSNRRLIARVVLMAVLITGAGYVMATRGAAIAEKTGLGSSFIGAILVAIGTSLPEISTTVTAVRLGRYEMAFGDIFGTNLFDIALLLIADLIFARGPVLNTVGSFSVVAALLATLLTTIYLIGLLERRNRTILRMGVDSFAVILIYLAGVVILYTLR